MTSGTPLPSRRAAAADTHAAAERAQTAEPDKQPTHAEGPTQHGGAENASKWASRPMLAKFLRYAILILPSLVSFIVTFVLARKYPPYEIGVSRLFWWVSLFSVGVLVMLATERITRRLLPLAALFKLSLVFPDAAPSRFNLAMKTNSTRKLERRLEEVRENGIPDDSAEHAELMLELVAALSFHDRLTRGHCERVRAYTDMISEEMKLSEEDTSKLRWAALLHDVGKIYVSSDILNKEGRPTEDEWESLKSHTWKGDDLIEPLREFLGPWAYAVRNHHERWDGNGYPDRLGGKEIPLGARIVAVADAFDVMTSARSYKEPRPASEAREEIARCAGGQFDPEVARAFLNIGLGRLRFAVGPLSWLANISAVGNAPAIVGTAVTQSAGSFVATAAATVVAIGGFASEPPQEIAFEAPPITVDAPEVADPMPVEVAEPAPTPAEVPTPGPTPAPTPTPEPEPEPQERPAEVPVEEAAPITPKAQAGIVTLAEDTATPVILTSDAAGLETIFILIEGPKNGSLSLSSRATSLAALTAGEIDPSSGPQLREGTDLEADFEPAGRPSTMTATYEPDENYYGTDDFKFRVCNAEARTLCSDATVSLQVSAVNDAPIARDNSITIDEDTTLNLTPGLVLANDVDVEGDDLTVTWINPSSGASTVQDGIFTYTPPANSTRDVRVRYRACDAEACGDAFVDVTVVALDDAPVANDDLVTTDEDESLVLNQISLGLNDEEYDGEDVEFTWLPHPDLDMATSTFTPQLNSTDAVELEYELCDAGNGLCDRAIVTVEITPLPDDPIAFGETFSLDEDTKFDALLRDLKSNDVDPDGEDFSLAWGEPNVSGGTLTIDDPAGSDPKATYQPPADYVGLIDIPYQVCVGPRCSPEVTLSLEFEAVNDAPRLDQDLAFAGTENNNTEGLFSDILDSVTDIDDDRTDLRIEFNQPVPPGFSFVLDAANNQGFVYTPVRHSIADVEVPYEACDDSDECTAGIFTLTFAEQDDPPEPSPLVHSTYEDTTFYLNGTTFEALVGDPDSALEDLTFTFTQTNPTLGTVSYDTATQEFKFIPEPDEFGQTIITYTACDLTTTTGCPSNTITLTVDPINDAPTIEIAVITEQHAEDAVVSFSDAALQALVADVDTDLADLTFNIDPTATGSLVQSGQGFTFTPDAEYVGPVTITFNVCDDEPLCSINSGEIKLDFTILDDAPDPTDIITTAVDEDPVTPVVGTRSEMVIAANDIDTADADLTFTETSPPTPNVGTLIEQPDGDWHFTPHANANGTTTYEIQVCDTNTDPGPNCELFNVTFEVNPINDPPVLNVTSITFPGFEDTRTEVTSAQLDALNIASDPDSPTSDLDYFISDPGSGLTVSAAGDSFFYDPITDSNADVVMNFIVCDQDDCSGATGQITMTFAPNDDPPETNDLAIGPIDEDPTTAPGFTRIQLEAATIDIDTPLADLTFTVSGRTGDDLGSWSDPGDGGLELSVIPNANGIATYEVDVCDATSCGVFHIDVEINAINDPPQITSDPTPVSTRFQPAVDVVLPVDFVVEDPDSGDTHSVVLGVLPPGRGTVAEDLATGDWVLTPNELYGGTQFDVPFDVCDDDGDCAASKWEVNVVPNGAPAIGAFTIEKQFINVASTPVDFTVTDPDGDVLTITEETLPAGLNLSGSNGSYTISGTLTDSAFLGQDLNYTLKFSDGFETTTRSGTISVSSQGLSPYSGDIIFTEVASDDVRACAVGGFLCQEQVEGVEVLNISANPIFLGDWTVQDHAPGDAPDANGLVLDLSNNLLFGVPMWETTLGDGDYDFFSPFASGANFTPYDFNGDDLWLIDNDGLIVDYVGWQDNLSTEVIPIPEPALGLWDTDRAAMVEIGGKPIADNKVSISLATLSDANTAACWEFTTSGFAGTGAHVCPESDTTTTTDNPDAQGQYGMLEKWIHSFGWPNW